jgi:hypothetical protein
MGLMSLKEYGLAYEPSGRDYAYSLYQPVADLNLRAQKEKQVSKSDIDQIERYADRLFASLNIDVEFTRHFMDRVNDARNKTPITPAELTRLFRQSYRKHGKKIKNLGPDAEAVLNDMQTDINMPFVLKVDGNELDLVAKTVMRKKNFKTKGPKLSFEEFKQKDKKRKLPIETPGQPKIASVDTWTQGPDNAAQIHTQRTFNITTPGQVRDYAKLVTTRKFQKFEEVDIEEGIKPYVSMMKKDVRGRRVMHYRVLDKDEKEILVTTDKGKAEKFLKKNYNKLKTGSVKPIKEDTIEEKGLWHNIHMKRKRGERMRKKGEKGAPTPAQMAKAKAASEDNHTPLDRIKADHKREREADAIRRDRELDRARLATARQMNTEKAPDTSDAMKRYKAGKAGFTDIAHLKAKGLIKRSDGTKRKSDKYK